MQRTLIVSLAVGLALSSLGCAHRYHNDGSDYRDYYERHLRYRNQEGTGGRLDLNRASTRELEDLPGVGRCDADRILANRPYADKRELVDRRIIPADQYDVIESFVYACPICPDRCDDAHRCVRCRADKPPVERRG